MYDTSQIDIKHWCYDTCKCYHFGICSKFAVGFKHPWFGNIFFISIFFIYAGNYLRSLSVLWSHWGGDVSQLCNGRKKNFMNNGTMLMIK